MAITQYWMDNAGLFQVYGVDQATTENAGEYRNNGLMREIELKLTLTDYAFGATNYVIADNVFMPTGVRIAEVATYVETAGTGATATLDIGLLRTDRTTVTSANGIIAAKTVASMVVGEDVTVVPGSTFAGALIGTTTSSVNYITARVNTASFTAGVIRIRIRYYKP